MLPCNLSGSPNTAAPKYWTDPGQPSTTATAKKMSLASQPATRAGGPRPDDSDEEDDGPPGDLYQPSHFQDTQCGDLAQPSHFGTGETLAELSARMSQLESVSRRNTRGSMESAASCLLYTSPSPRDRG